MSVKEKPDAQGPLFSYFSPLGSFQGIVSIPHSGEEVPQDFNPYLVQDSQVLKQDVDFRVHQLVDVDRLRASGLAVIYSHIIRTAVDLNRAPEIAVLAWEQNTQGKKVVTKTLESSEREKLTQKYYWPYYEMLKSLIHEYQRLHQRPTPFVDLHSMPSKPTAYHLKQNPKQEQSRPDFCLSDYHGKTCTPEFMQHCHSFFSDYEALINQPYIGGHITQWVGEHDTNNIQIEINRRLYMNEENQSLKENEVKKLKDFLTKTLIGIFKV